jgi:Flp pilus assembly protein TadD
MDAEDGRTNEAVEHWRDATRIDPSEFGRIFLLGVSLARAGRIGPARACFTFFADAAPAQYDTEIATARKWLTSAR